MADMKEILKKLLLGKNIFRILIGAMTTYIFLNTFHVYQFTAIEIVLDLTLFAVLLLISYIFASVIGEEIIVRRQTNWRRFFEIVSDVSPVLLATFLPILIFVIASFGIIKVKTGLLLSDLSILLILFSVGFLAGKAIGGIVRGLLDGALAATIGAGIALLRIIIV